MSYFDTTVLHLVWSLVNSHAHFLSSLSDDAIALWLLKTVREKRGLTTEDNQALQQYITERTPLIRDIIEPPSLLSP